MNATTPITISNYSFFGAFLPCYLFVGFSVPCWVSSLAYSNLLGNEKALIVFSEVPFSMHVCLTA
jgi:hypothetical protein